MAGSGGRYVKSKNSNPFFDDDDQVDDDTFLKNARTPVKSPSSNSAAFSSLGGKLTGRNSFQPLDDDGDSFGARREPLTQEERLEQMLREKQRIEERTLEASRRAKGVLDETEKIGVSTAEELLHQREQLERTGQRLDEMNNSLRSSEKHIQSIKSVFSSFKSYFSKPSATAAGATASDGSNKPTISSTSSDSALAKTLQQQQSGSQQTSSRDPMQHPALRIRGLENDFSHKPLSNVDEQLEQDLGDMSQSLARLKGLAQGLGTEIDDQNQLLDRLQTSTDKADWRIQRQNKDMERLLKK